MYSMQMIFSCIIDPNYLSTLQDCPTAIMDWMSDNFLKFNPDKTEAFIVGPESVSKKKYSAVVP